VFVERETECWKCGAVIKVYTWEGHELWAKECPEEGRPASVQWRFSQDLGEEYWVNTCSECGIIQGDWFLYLEDLVFADIGTKEEAQGVVPAPGGSVD